MPEQPDPWAGPAAEPGSQADTMGGTEETPSELEQTIVQEAAPRWLRLLEHWRAFLADQVSPVRMASHVALLLVAGLVVVLSRVDLPQWEGVRLPQVQSAELAEAAPQLALVQQAIGGSPLQGSGVLLRASVPFTEIPDRPRTDIITYTVQIEDTILGIAEKYGLNPNTIVWSNQELTDNPFLLEIGQQLVILPVDGVYHRTKEGDTVEKLASTYRVPAEVIIGYSPNGLASAEQPLTAGQMIVVPGGDATPPEPPRPPAVRQTASSPARGASFAWPTYGILTQGYWLPAHPAIDLGASTGTTVRAADDGIVAQAGWSSYGYGNYVVINHYDGYQTLYAHLNRIDVSPGEAVARSQQIGAVGSTGRSTGPHLHFEVILNGRSYNPLLYLP
jgi:murein DD-endopeptidase MepM/ murein hydrolase activator NlpD